ncbi:hypothetical protein C1751_07625 [Pseudomonas fluorescens]|nr:hypothetical protein C1751_07625 [Pseudomonas fluorescens]
MLDNKTRHCTGIERRSNVGAGLPAMASTRCFSCTESSVSQASQIPHLSVSASGLCHHGGKQWGLKEPL